MVKYIVQTDQIVLQSALLKRRQIDDANPSMSLAAAAQPSPPTAQLSPQHTGLRPQSHPASPHPARAPLGDERIDLHQGLRPADRHVPGPLAVGLEKPSETYRAPPSSRGRKG